MRKYIALMFLLGFSSYLWADLSQSYVRVDTRESFGGRLATGIEMRGEANGASYGEWDTTTLPNGWHQLVSSETQKDVCVINGEEVIILGGKIEENLELLGNQLYILRDNLIIPSGVKVTIGKDAILKFTEHSVIRVKGEGHLELQGVALTDIADDSIGGDTNLDGDASAMPEVLPNWIEGNVQCVTLSLFDGGNLLLPKLTYTMGEKYGQLPVLERSDAMFNGWSKNTLGDGDLVEPNMEVDFTVASLYASWTNAQLSLPENAMTIGYMAKTYAFDLESNIDWEIESSVDWVTLDLVRGEGNATIQVTVSENHSTSNRSAVLKVKSATYAGVGVREFTIEQEGMELLPVPQIILSKPGISEDTFEGKSYRIGIKHDNPRVELRYTLDGTEPTRNSLLARTTTGKDGGAIASFNIYETTTIKVCAFLEGYFESDVASAHIRRLYTLAEALDVPLWKVTTSGDANWFVNETITHDGVACAQSGKIENGETSTIETTVYGDGVLTFWWYVSCEDDTVDDNWDRLTFYVDDNEIARIDGESGWQLYSVKLKGETFHTLKWVYSKDANDFCDIGEDCARIDYLQWTPVMEGMDIPLEWFEGQRLLGTDGSLTIEIAAMMDTDRDGLTNAQEYIAGTDPADAFSNFKAYISFDEETKEPIITWEPNLMNGRTYRVYGKASLSDEDWTTPVTPNHHFFKVEVDNQ